MSKEIPSLPDPRRLSADLERGRVLFKTLNEFAVKLLGIPSEDDLVWHVARQVVGRMGFDDCVVYLLEPERDLLRQRAAIGAKNPRGNQIVNALEIPVGQGITGRVAQSLQPLIVNDLSRYDGYIADVEPALSEICVPLIIGGKAVGVIDCEDPRSGYFGEQHLEILATVAAMASARLKIIYDARRAEERRAELHRLNQQLRAEVAERRHAEEALRRSQAQLQSIMDHSPALISIKSLDGRYTYISPSYARYFGTSAARAVGKTVAEVLPPNLAAAVAAADGPLIEADAVQQPSEPITVDTGSSILLLTKFPIRNGDGKTIFIGTIGVDITGQRQAEEALRRSQAQLQSIMDHSPALITIKDLSGRYTYVSPAYSNYFGIPAERAVGRTAAEFLPPEASATIKAGDQTVFDTGVPQQLDRTYSSRIGSPNLLVTKFPIRDDQGEIVSICTIAIDITEQRQAEDRLRQATQLAGVGYYVWDTVEDRCLFCSKQHARIYGLSAEDYIARASTLEESFALTHPDDRKAVRTAMRRLRGGEPVEVEYRTVTPSGKTHYVREIAEPVFDEAGRVVQEIGASQDISDIKRAETLLAGAMDASPAVFALFGPDDRLVICNRKYRDMYETEAVSMVKGVAFEDLVRAFAANIGIGVGGAETEDWIAKRLDRRNEPARSYEYRRSDGEWMEVSDFLLEDGSVFTVGQIITEKKLLEAQIQQAQKMEAIGQLTGGVAHDFNNLLAVIQGNAELVAEKAEPGDGHIQAIMRAAKRGGELTQRLLAFSRQTSLRPQPIDLPELLAGMSDLLAVSLGATIEVEIRTDDGLWPTMADPSQVENALLNLALNARDAMPTGGRLTLHCANMRLGEAGIAKIGNLADGPAPEAGDYVMLAVTDTGEGMTPAVAARAFEPFFSTKGVGQGSGLGLSMVYGFARQSGGYVAVDSKPGRGTTMKLYLPRAEEAPAVEDTAPVGAVPRGRGESVLVIEDDGDVRAFAVDMLKDLGYRVTAVADAAAAQAVLDATESGEEPDLLLSDVVLPGGTSGPRFAEQACARRPNLKAIFMSGYPADERDGNGLVGVDQVLLGKPFRRWQLAKALRNALD